MSLSVLIAMVVMENPDNSELVENKCYECLGRKPVPGTAHIECVTPDHDMRGSEHGIREGWFMYPLVFDPTWMTRKCKNFKSAVSNAVSGAEVEE